MFEQNDLPEIGRPVIELEVVRSNVHRLPGRPTILDRRCFVRICQRVQTGCSTVEACLAEGVSYRLQSKTTAHPSPKRSAGSSSRPNPA